MKRSPLAVVTAILAAALLVLLGAAGPALAHDVLKSSSPAKGAEVRALDEVRLEFSARVRMPFVVVRGPGDVQVQAGEPKQDGAVVRQAVKGPLPDGRYTIAYRVLSSDGHPLEGEIPFRVKGAPAAAPEASEPVSAPASEQASAPPSPASSGGPQSPAGDTATAGPGQAVAAEEAATFPVWLIIVIGALVGIGIGFLFSARRSRS